MRLSNWTGPQQHDMIPAMFAAAGVFFLALGLLAAATVVRWLWRGEAWWDPGRLRRQRNWHPSFAPTRRGLPHMFWLAVILRSIQAVAAVAFGVYFVWFKG